jgi:tetratricopeptide (TPR) repeat protein
MVRKDILFMACFFIFTALLAQEKQNPILFAQSVASDTTAAKAVKPAAADETQPPAGAPAAEQAPMDDEKIRKALQDSLAKVIADSIRQAFEQQGKETGFVHYENKEYAKAERSFLNVLPSNKNDIKMLEALADCQAHLKKYKKALKVYQDLFGLELDVKYALKMAEMEEKLKAPKKDLIFTYENILKLNPNHKETRLKLARLQYEKSPKKEALLKTIIELDPKDVKSMVMLATLYLKKQQYQKAEPVLVKAMSVDEKNEKVRTMLTDCYLKQKKIKKATRVLAISAQSEADNKKRALIQKQLGDLYSEIKESKKAIKHYEGFIGIYPKDKSVHKKLLSLYKEIKAAEKEKAALSNLIRLEPRNIEHLQLRGDLYYAEGNYEPALKDYLAIQKIRPRYKENSKKIGMLFFLKKDYANAIKFLVRIASNDDEAAATLADCYLQLKQGRKAVRIYKDLLKKKPKDLALSRKIYLLTEEYKLGKASLKAAYNAYLKLAPNDLEVLIKVARMEAQSKDPKVYEAALIKMVQLKPKEIQPRLVLAQFYMSKRQYKKAMPVLQKAYKINSNHKELLLALAKNYSILGQQKDVAKVLEKAVPMEKDKKVKGQLHKRLGLLFLELKDSKKAMFHLEAYVKLNPKDVDAHTRLLDLYRKAKDVKKEKATLAVLARLKPGNINFLQTKGDMAYQAGQMDDALADYLAIKKARPGYKKNDLKIGTIYYTKKDYPNAEKLLSRSAGKDEKALVALGNCYIQLKREKKALAVYKRLLVLRPEDKALAKAIYTLAEKNCVRNNSLLDAYKSYLKLVPNDREVQLKAAYTTLLTLKSRNIEHLQFRGNLFLDTQDSAYALKDFLAILRINPGYRKNDLKIADIYYSQKNYARAERYLARSAGKNEGALKRLAHTYQELGKDRKALNSYRFLFSLKPENKAYAKKIVALSEKLKVSQADLAQAYQDLLRLEPKNKEVKKKLKQLNVKKQAQQKPPAIPKKKEPAKKPAKKE